MMEYLAAAGDGMVNVLTWPNILYPVVGTLAAMMTSFLPGANGLTLMAVALPLTLTWDPLQVLLLFGALVGGATFMGSVTAILFNVPGSAPNAAPGSFTMRRPAASAALYPHTSTHPVPTCSPPWPRATTSVRAPALAASAPVNIPASPAPTTTTS